MEYKPETEIIIEKKLGKFERKRMETITFPTAFDAIQHYNRMTGFRGQVAKEIEVLIKQIEQKLDIIDDVDVELKKFAIYMPEIKKIHKREYEKLKKKAKKKVDAGPRIVQPQSGDKDAKRSG